MSNRPRPEAEYPDTGTWLAALDHTKCTQLAGVCIDVHCVACGASIGHGWAMCGCQSPTP